MKWPRGRYNGRRITGFQLKFIFDVRCWTVRVFTGWTKGFILGPFRWYLELDYE